MESIALTIEDLIGKHKETLSLEDLKDDDLLQILKRHAFGNVEDPQDYPKLTPIAAEIAKKLLGSPLIAKAFSHVLNDRLDETHWDTVLNSNNLRNRSDIFSILKLSYIFLQDNLKDCYAFCALYPHSVLFWEDDLINMWILMNFTKPSSTDIRNDKEIGQSYLDILLNKSLLEKKSQSGTRRTYYKFHELLYESVRSVSRDRYFTINGDENMSDLMISTTIRHLYVRARSSQVLSSINITQFKYLRSLHLCYFQDAEGFLGELAMVFKTCTLICLLVVDGQFASTRMPEEFGHLIHLKYVSVRDPNCSEEKD